MRLSRGARRLFKLIQDLSRHSGLAFMFHSKMAVRCETTEPSLRRHLAELRRGGYIASRKRQHSSAEYRILRLIENDRSGDRSGDRSDSPVLLLSNLSEYERRVQRKPSGRENRWDRLLREAEEQDDRDRARGVVFDGDARRERAG